MTIPKGLKLALLIAALGAGLCGCVAYPAYPYGGDYGYYGGSAYSPYDDGYAAPFYGGVFIGGGHDDRDWHDRDDWR
jgi:hypothetical protein